MLCRKLQAAPEPIGRRADEGEGENGEDGGGVGRFALHPAALHGFHGDHAAAGAEEAVCESCEKAEDSEESAVFFIACVFYLFHGI